MANKRSYFEGYKFQDYESITGNIIVNSTNDRT